MKLPFFVTLALLAITPQVVAQPGLLPELRSAVYRIENPRQREGTAVMFGEKSYNFLITNLHVVTDDSGKVCDSLWLYVNHTQDNGEVVSGPDHVTVYPTTEKNKYFFKPDTGSLDIVLISLGTENTSESADQVTIFHIKTSLIPSSESLSRLLDSNSVMTAIGYPAKRVIQGTMPRSPEYRWGRITGQDSSFLKMDIPVLPGSSGSPIVMEKEGEYYFVGIATLLVNDTCHALRASAIRDCFPRYFDYISRH